MQRVVVITGASGGIGAALARQLGSQGYLLALGARREEQLLTVARESGPSALAVVADVTRRADVERLRDEALKKFGRVDVWVNNAGQGILRGVLDLTDEDLDAIMAVNVKSALYGMQAIVPHFMARGTGHLINISSLLGRVPMVTFRSAYNAAKSALNALTANLRMEMKARAPGVKVSLVMPGMTSTDFARNARGAPPDFSFRPGAMPSQAPEEVAQAIIETIERPVAEIYTNPALGEIVRRYREDPEAFEESMLALSSWPAKP